MAWADPEFIAVVSSNFIMNRYPVNIKLSYFGQHFLLIKACFES